MVHFLPVPLSIKTKDPNGENHGPYQRLCSGPGQVTQVVRASSQYVKTVSLIPGQDTYKKQRINTLLMD